MKFCDIYEIQTYIVKFELCDHCMHGLFFGERKVDWAVGYILRETERSLPCHILLISS
jgi:hypothetical protein